MVTPDFRFSRNASSFSSLMSLRSQIQVSSMGVGIPSIPESSSIRESRSQRKRSAHMATASSRRQGEFDELISGVGTQMDDELSRLLSIPGFNKAFDGHGISRWQFDMQSRPMPLGILKRRRHTAPSIYPAQLSFESSLSGQH